MRDMADRSAEEDSASIWTHVEKRNRSHEKERGNKQERQTQGEKKTKPEMYKNYLKVSSLRRF
jgi:hypothetical protein